MWLKTHLPEVLDADGRPSFCRQVFGSHEFEAQGSKEASLTGGAGGEENSEIPESFTFGVLVVMTKQCGRER